MTISKGFDAASIPRRTPMIQSAIEALQKADDTIRRGEDPGIDLVVAHAAVQTLLEKYTGRRRATGGQEG